LIRHIPPEILKAFEEQVSDGDQAKIRLGVIQEESMTFLDPVSLKTVVLEDHWDLEMIGITEMRTVDSQDGMTLSLILIP
jgi:hypothetical protein